MNILGAFLELDKLYESVDWLDRETLIKNIKASGKNYNFNKYSDAQLYSIWERIQNEEALRAPIADEPELTREYCEYCGELRNPLGQCPICDLGEDDMFAESLDVLEIGNHITDNYIFPSSRAKYDCILDIKSRYHSFDDIVSQDDLDRTVAKYGGKLTENKKALTESIKADFLSIEGFDHYIEDTFEDDGYIGYEVVYSKNGTEIVKAEIWEVDNGVMVIENLYAPNLMQRTYETFMQFAEDLEYKCDTYLHEAKSSNWNDLLTEAAELSMDHAVNSVVDQVKAVYEAGLFTKLPVGRENAFTLEISGPDKERLTGYFQRQPEFNYELNNDSGIISHEFISNEYDIEIFDTFVSMYKIPQNESLNLSEDIFDDFNVDTKRSAWVARTPTTNAASVATPAAPITTQNQPNTSNKNIVTIVYDWKAHKLRARADDGIHGEANVAFPNNLRNAEGQQYEVEELVWNGKNYRATGDITPVNNVSNIHNINENVNKENCEMNFQTILEELDRLYEEQLPAEEPEEKEEKALTEADDAEILIDDEPIVDDEAVEVPVDETEEAPKQLVLECSKCGAISLKNEEEVVVDEATDLANVEEACTACEATEGYKVIGAVVPYEIAEEVEEVEEAGEAEEVEEVEEAVNQEELNELFGLGKKKTKGNSKTTTDKSAPTESTVTISIYDENGTEQFSQTFKEIQGKKSAEEQFNDVIKSNGVLNKYKSSQKKFDWSYERKSNPSSAFDTDKYFNAASKIIKG